MNTKKIRWRLAQKHIAHLSKSLNAVRSQEQVANLMGCSPALIAQLERSAFRKIICALLALDPEQQEEAANCG